MNINRFFSIVITAGSLCLLTIFTGSPIFAASVFSGQEAVSGRGAPSVDTCDNPILINSINVTHTICGLSTGTININLAGGNNGYSFQWAPNVSTSNSALLLPAAAYQVTITRLSNPACQIDTTIIVNNSNGPSVQVVDIEPSNCLAANGQVTLAPTNLFYVWDNGEVGAVNDGLLSICYYITATNPGNGCSTVFKVCVPNENPLETSAQVLEPAKCGHATGAAEILVNGGSGVYSYSLGASSTIDGLLAGNYDCEVVDNVTGCTDDVAFTIPAAQVSATVNITPYNIACPGGGTGFVGFEVIPGANFDLPFSFSIRDSNNMQFQPGNLTPGKYYLSIVDADSCMLPIDSFYITEPDPIVTQAQIIPETCEQGGQIQLSFSGGNGGYRVDWLDLPGSVNTEDRINLPAGIYKAIVFDSLFCTDTLDTYLVPSFCAKRDTLPFILPAGTTGSLCLETPIGIQLDDIDFQLIGASASGVSTHGSWVLDAAQGCLIYSAGLNPGFAVDTICIAANVGQFNLSDTTCIIVTLTAQAPTEEIIYFTVQTDQAATSCGIIPPVFNNPLVVQLNRPGLSGTSDAYGNYLIHPESACLTFWANALPGYNVDTIAVAALDTVLLRSHFIRYVPSVLPPTDCSAGFIPEDSLAVLTSNCAAGGMVCIPVPYGEIGDFAITDNDLPYLNGYLGCNLDTVIAYALSLLPPNGPYQLNEWTVNGQSFSGAFQDANGLVALMNQLDPVPGWNFQNNFFIIGGNPANTYGAIKVTSSQAVVGVLQPNLQFIPRGTQLRLAAGTHELVLRRIQTGCADTATIRVTCIDCPPIHNYPLDFFGNVEWEAASCGLDTLFCTNILASELNDFDITDNGSIVSATQSCVNGRVGFRFDTGYHFIQIRNTISTCEYEVKFYFNCPPLVLDDTVAVMLIVGQNTVICPNQTLLAPPIVSIGNVCGNDNGNVTYSFNQQTFCASLTGNTPGLDTLCLQICNADGDCYTTAVIATVSAEPQDTITEARPDEAVTVKNTPVEIPVLANDLIENGLGNLGALAELLILNPPGLGQAEYHAATGTITYTPHPDTCGTDAFIYRIKDKRDVQDTALVRITVNCDKLLIFNGFSPNGDNLNDVWHIPGIEDYPANTVQVFNRWGNLVFEQKGYNKQNAWDGRWNGKDLPDGTYYYLIDLGKGQKPLSGYLQLIR